MLVPPKPDSVAPGLSCHMRRLEDPEETFLEWHLQLPKYRWSADKHRKQTVWVQARCLKLIQITLDHRVFPPNTVDKQHEYKDENTDQKCKYIYKKARFVILAFSMLKKKTSYNLQETHLLHKHTPGLCMLKPRPSSSAGPPMTCSHQSLPL